MLLLWSLLKSDSTNKELPSQACPHPAQAAADLPHCLGMECHTIPVAMATAATTLLFLPGDSTCLAPLPQTQSPGGTACRSREEDRERPEGPPSCINGPSLGLTAPPTQPHTTGSYMCIHKHTYTSNMHMHAHTA